MEASGAGDDNDDDEGEVKARNRDGRPAFLIETARQQWDLTLSLYRGKEKRNGIYWLRGPRQNPTAVGF
ncbi:unnamed protein product [Linum tenue]|uniref:Uncharacterized protein n=1 Tax=Linum tenue TaxID=586396 RepID=A0AAV0LJD7_9ROSI|nr:unnamed protein product [Linum tenue]